MKTLGRPEKVKTAGLDVDRATPPDNTGTGRRTGRKAKAMLVMADVAVIAVAILLTSVVAVGIYGWSVNAAIRYAGVGLVSLAVWPFLFMRQRMYAARFVTRLFDEIRRASTAVALGAVALVLAGWALDVYVSRVWTATFAVLAMMLITGERFMARSYFRKRRESGRSLRRVVIVGTNAEARDLFRSLGDPSLGYRVVGFVATDEHAPADIAGLPVRKDPTNLVEIARALGAHGVVVATTAMELGLSRPLLRELLDDGLHVELTSGLSDVTPERMTIHPLGRHPVVYLEPTRRTGWRAVAKRSFDIAVALVVLIVASPLILAAAIAIKVTSAGPVFFRQERIGRDGDSFWVLKLRTMVVDAEERLAELLEQNESDGPLFKVREDPRITRAGRYLRKLSIDELPQLWNVVRGDMSLVGPRPALPREVAGWTEELFDRLRVRPGITGMWQVSGRSGSGFEEYQRLDLFYVDNWSILIDLGILARTVPTVLSGRGAY